MITINLNFKNYLDELIDAGKEFSSKFFSNQENKDLLNNNDFDTLYLKWGIFPAGLTALFIKSNIEFLSYMSSIPKGCFDSLPITKIIIPSNIKQIDSSCFGYCQLLKEIIILDGCERIDMYAFSFCGELISLSIPKSVKFIGSSIARNSDLLQRINYRGTRKNWATTKLHWQWELDSHIHEIKFIDGTIQEI